MLKKAVMLAQRREELLACSTIQRESLALQVQYLMHPLSHVDTGISLIKRIKKSPTLLAGLAIGLIAIKPRRVFAMLRNGAMAWQTWRTIAPAVQGLLSRPTK